MKTKPSVWGVGGRHLPRARRWALTLCAAGLAGLPVQGQEELPYPCELLQELVPLQGKLTGHYAYAEDQFGLRLALTGRRLVASARLDDDRAKDTGAVFVYTQRSASYWRQEAKIVPSDGRIGAMFGNAVATAGDMIVVGAYGDDDRGENAGAAYVYRGSSSSWWQQAKLTAADTAAGDYFGFAAAISGDTLVLGAHGNDERGTDAGAAYVFVWDGSAWIQQAKLTASNAAAGDILGCSAAMTGDTLVLGASGNDERGTDAGAAYVFVWDGSAWIQQAKLLASDGSAGDRFGGSVALDGDTVVVGAPNDDQGNSVDSGAVYVFVRQGTVWTQQAKLSAGLGYDYFGASVTLDGDTLVAGAPCTDINRSVSSTWDAGAAYVFVRSSGVWSQRATLVANDRAGGDNYGISAVISDGTLVVGAYLEDDLGVNAGAAYVLSGQDATWSFQTKITAGDTAENDQLGRAVAWKGDTIALAAPYDTDCAVGYGSVSVFVSGDGGWLPQAKLTAREGPSDQGYGNSIALGPDMLVVAAQPGPPASGSVYTYLRHDTNWVEHALLTTPEANPEDGFGSAVGLDANTLIVGAKTGDGREPDSGVAYVYSRQGAGWVYQAKLMADDGVTYDSFGAAVAIDGDTVAVGALLGGSHSTADGAYGAVYIFARQGTEWIQTAKLVAHSGEPSDYVLDYFGEVLALSGDTVLVGTRLDESMTGCAYVFVRQGVDWVLQAKLTADEGESNDQFGQSLALDGDLALVAASYDQGADYYGSVYVFVRENGHWSEQGKLTPCVGVGNDLPHAGLALNGTGILVGAPNEDAIASMSGAAYLLEWRGSEEAIASYADGLLYYDLDQTDPASPAFRELAAFRYKQKLYGFGTDGLRARFDTLRDLYGPGEQARADHAQAILKRALQCFTTSATLRTILLDSYYDRAVAESLLAKQVLAQADNVRLGLVSPSLAFVIDDEITILRDALAVRRNALAGHFALLSDGFGSDAVPPLGYEIFRQDVPGRALTPATCLVTNEQTSEISIEPVTDDPSSLVDGYKDLVLVYQLLSDYGRTAAELARLQIARNGPNDDAGARELVGATQRFLLMQIHALQGVFPNPTYSQSSGMANAVAAVNDSLAQLEDLKQTLRGEANLLGFDRDFLFFVSRFTGASTNYYDSYDAFRERLVTASGPLTLAATTLATAQTAYDTSRDSEDQLSQHFAESSITYRDRLRDIVGVFPGEAKYSDDPTANPGSELDQQYRSIEAARLRILRNRAEISNLEQRIEIERKRCGDVQGTFLKYGNQRKDLVKEISRLKAAQAAADAVMGNLSFDSPWKFVGSLVAGAVNAGVQAGTELAIGSKEAELEMLAANEKADVEGIDSAAQVKTWLLEMNTLVIDSQEAALLFKQEINRLKGLYREKADLERKIAEMDTRLARRYFADPVHRQRYSVATLRAHLAFDQAQKWLFFTARALEYKWNRPFDLPAGESPDGRHWRFQDLFKLRNADELQDLYNAMDAFDALYSGPSTSDDRFDWFSVREHFLGYLAEDAQGTPQFYVDPDTGETVSALEAFRRHLARRVVNNYLELDFSTVREIENRSFFRGPTYYADGTLDQAKKGSYLDKIRWIKIRLPGGYEQEPIIGYLTYGGVSYLRNPSVGVRDPNRPDRIANEATAYSTRYWYWDGRWRSNVGLTAEVSMLKVPRTETRLDGNPAHPDALPSVNQIDVFKERSVAATGWHLAIPVGPGAVPLDQLDDIELYFYHWSFNRP